ncbi:MAG: efflux transporter outer membrane subunit [Candidatus Binatia bacterium]
MRKYLLLVIVLSLTLSACNLAPAYQRPPMAIPEGWSVSRAAPQPQQQETAPFWQALENVELARLMQIALAQNLDLQAALHRIEQARAQAKVAGAGLLPSLDAGGGLSQTYQERRDDSRVDGFITLSYELDLWGRNRSQAEAATYRVEASQYDREALRLVVTTDTAVLFTRVLGFNDRIRIAENNLKNAEEILRIVEARFREGSVSALEVSQQKVVVNNIRSALTTLIEQQATTLNALAVLLGQAPQRFGAPQAELASLNIPTVNLTPPASLLTGRPDIQSAEAGLLAANADIGAARAAFFPSLQLGADGSLIAAGFGDPATTALSLAANVLAPIFSGGRLEGNLETVTARQRELAAQYQRTVLTAFQEVENALASLKSTAQQIALARESVQAAQNAYNIAKARFGAGSIDYLTLLETQRSLSQVEDEQVVATVAQLEAFVQLRKALGS